MRIGRHIAAVLTTAALLAGGAAVAPAAHAAPASAQSYSCNYYWDTNWNEYAGHYSGNTAVPSTTSVSSAGIEAQCLLKAYGYSPGTVDGIFGSNSQSAMKSFQRYMNSAFGAGLSVDGLPGPKSWPWLRWYGGTEY